MTAFEIAVPLIALSVAALGTALLRWETQKIDARIAERRNRKR